MKGPDYNKKIEICEKLGAKKFQKFVFGIERVKWKAIKKFNKNYISHQDKNIDKKTQRLLKQAETKAERDYIQKTAMLEKMFLRREYNNSENINYHIASRPSEFMVQLEWNKDTHKKSLKYNLILFPLFAGATIASSSVLFPVSVITGIITAFLGCSTFIDIECINIQNYNICRLKKIEKKLLQKEEQNAQKDIEKYGEAYKVVGKTLEEKKDIVDIEQVIDNIKTKDQAIQLKTLIEQEKEKRNKRKNIGGNKKCI